MSCFRVWIKRHAPLRANIRVTRGSSNHVPSFLDCGFRWLINERDNTMKTNSRRSFLGQGLQVVGFVGLTFRSSRVRADETANAAELATKAVNFLRPRQAADGSWSGDRKEPGITALVVTAMLRSGRVTPDDPAVARGLAYLERFLGPKGGLSEAPHSVYSTSVALMAFQAANKGGRFDRVIKGGQDFLKTTQWDEGEGKGKNDVSYGGLGYGGGNSRPDLSNTSFFIEALRDTGLPADDPALQKAIVFVSRCQNLKSEFNDQPGAGKVNDGGFVYTPTIGQQRGKGQDRQKCAGCRRKVRRRRRPALVCRNDVRRAQEHDLRRTHAGRSSGQGGPGIHPQKLHARRKPRTGSARALLLLPDVRQGDGPAR